MISVAHKNYFTRCNSIFTREEQFWCAKTTYPLKDYTYLDTHHNYVKITYRLERVLNHAKHHNCMKILKMSLEFVLFAGLGLFLLSTLQVSAQPLTKDTSTGNVTEVDISIDPAEPLPANGTVTISTEGAVDTDMNGFPPVGVHVIISSDTVTVTNQAVDIGTVEEENGGPESVGGTNEGTESGGGGTDEGTESGGGTDEGSESEDESADEEVEE